MDDNKQAESLLTLVGLIQNSLASIERQKKELAEHKQMLEDGFANDPVYVEHADKAKEAAKLKNQTKQQILKQPQLQQLSAKIKEMSQDLKELKTSLSDYLQEYARISGAREIEDINGEINEIVYTAKLIKALSARSSHRH